MSECHSHMAQKSLLTKKKNVNNHIFKFQLHEGINIDVKTYNREALHQGKKGHESHVYKEHPL